MWSEWDKLERAAVLAEMPFEALPALHSGIEMLLGADLQWDRFRDALARDRQWPREHPSIWSIETHFFLVAADNARDRLTLWARKIGDADVRQIVSGLDLPGLKDFRHHQEHLEERLPGERREQLAQLKAPGNSMIRIESGEVHAINNLSDGRYLHFGGEVLDLQAVHQAVIDTASRLLRWLEERSRFGQPMPNA